MDTSAKQTLPKINYGLPILPLIDSLYQLLIGALICIVSLAGIGFIVTGIATLVMTVLARKNEWAGLILFGMAFLNVPIAFLIGMLLDDVTVLQFYMSHSGLLLIIYGCKVFKDTELISLSALWRNVIMIPCCCVVAILELVCFYNYFILELDLRYLLPVLLGGAVVVLVILVYKLIKSSTFDVSGIPLLRASTVAWLIYSVASVAGLIAMIVLTPSDATLGTQILFAGFAYLVAAIPAYFLYIVGKDGIGSGIGVKVLAYVVSAFVCAGIAIGYFMAVSKVAAEVAGFFAIMIPLTYIALAVLYAYPSIKLKWYPYLLPVTAVLVPIVVIACMCYMAYAVIKNALGAGSGSKSTKTVWEVVENGVKYHITQDSNGNYYDECNRRWETNDGGSSFYRV